MYFRKLKNFHNMRPKMLETENTFSMVKIEFLIIKSLDTH